MKPLPLLTNSPPQFQSCDDDHHRCEKCPLYKSRCKGCIELGRRDTNSLLFCNQGNCLTQCNGCGGARGVDVPTICCKNPTLKIAFPELPLWGVPGNKNDLQNYHQAEPLNFKSKGINMNQGSPGKTLLPYPTETEVVAVSLRHVWSPRKGFWSQDLKDYCRLPSGTKLIVTTMTKDDELESYWKYDMHGGTKYERVGIDYWMPVMFSNYREKGQMSNFYDGLRSFKSLKEGNSQFIPMAFMNLMVEDLVLEAAKTIKNAMFNGQFILGKDLLKVKINELLYWHYVLPMDVNFYIVGPYSPKTIVNIKRFIKRPIYFISVSPWMAAVRGKIYNRKGKERKNLGMSIKELLWYNQRTYFDLCSMDVSKVELNEEEKKFSEGVKEIVNLRRSKGWIL